MVIFFKFYILTVITSFSISQTDPAVGGVQLTQSPILLNHGPTEPRLINDLTSLETEKEIRFTNEIPQPIVMADEDFNTSDLFVQVSGYGRTCGIKNECPNTKTLEMMMMELTTLSFDECIKYHTNLLPNMFCHIDKSERSTSSFSDSGGPVAFARCSQTILLGILSHGWDCDSTDITVWSFIPKLREWIRSVTKV